MSASIGLSEKKLALVIANPATTGDIPAYLAAIRAAAPPEFTIEVRFTKRGDDPFSEIRGLAESADLLIAAGGDGTVSNVAELALKTGVPLAILPAGSANVIARDLRIPFDPGAAARLVFGPHLVRKIDIGRCNDYPFMHMGGAGVDSRMFLHTDTTLKKRHGWKAYFVSGFREVFSEPATFKLTTEHGTFTSKSPLILVAIGGSLMWPQFQIAPDISRDDGYFDVFVFTATDPRKLFQTLSRIAARRLEGSKDVIRIRCRSLTIESNPAVPVEIDGDVVADGTARFTIDPEKVNVIVPENS
jgi:diacylglycerol kinase family enzyme